MISKTVYFDELVRANRWRVEIFTDTIDGNSLSKWPMRSMADIATESSNAIMPSDSEDDQLLYVGLENVESITGEPVALQIRSKAEIRSRSKVFRQGNILYGRLRPYLRKAFLAMPPFDHGICSTEFIVIIPNTQLILPQLLRVLLVSQAATGQFARFQIGAALPRISSKDFFSVSLPVPPLEVQRAWLVKAAALEEAYREARAIVMKYPSTIELSVENLLSEIASD
jgi:hypothetical protein